jgi:hypothetical protein
MMSTNLKTSSIPPDILADGDAVIESIMTGKPLNPEIAKRIQERGDRIREQIFQKHGYLDIAVAYIRELRDS